MIENSQSSRASDRFPSTLTYSIKIFNFKLRHSVWLPISPSLQHTPGIVHHSIDSVSWCWKKSRYRDLFPRQRNHSQLYLRHVTAVTLRLKTKFRLRNWIISLCFVQFPLAITAIHWSLARGFKLFQWIRKYAKYLWNMQNICSSKLQNMCPAQNFHQLHINTSEYLGHADIHRTAPQPLQLQGWTNFNGCQKFGLWTRINTWKHLEPSFKWKASCCNGRKVCLNPSPMSMLCVF